MRGRFRELLASDELLVAPGIYDGLSAHLAQQAGFQAAYLTGAGTSASMIGQPDIGLTTQTEVATHAGRMTAVLEIPLVVDTDAGFGNELNVWRTVREFERAGVAAIQLEDQGDHRRCGHLGGKEVVSTAEYVTKLAAALDARIDPDLVIIARTDARAPEGFAAALKRAQAYQAAGADMIFFEAPQSLDEIATIAAEVPGPLMFNVVARGATPPVSREWLTELGYRFAIVPGVAIKAAADAIAQALTDLATPDGWQGAQESVSSRSLFELVGLRAWDERLARLTAGEGSGY